RSSRNFTWSIQVSRKNVTKLASASQNMRRFSATRARLAIAKGARLKLETAFLPCRFQHVTADAVLRAAKPVEISSEVVEADIPLEAVPHQEADGDLTRA